MIHCTLIVDSNGISFQMRLTPIAMMFFVVVVVVNVSMVTQETCNSEKIIQSTKSEYLAQNTTTGKAHISARIVHGIRTITAKKNSPV